MAEVTSVENALRRHGHRFGFVLAESPSDVIRRQHESARTLAHREGVGLPARLALNRISHSVSVGRVTEGFYDTALNEADNA